MKNLERTWLAFFLVAIVLAACAGPGATPVPATPLPASSPTTGAILPASDKIVYYYFVDPRENPPPAGSVVISPRAYILAPTPSALASGSDPAADLRSALESALQDGRNGWISNKLGIIKLALDHGHADVVLEGEYFGVGDVTLVAARMQILMTLFANPAVQSAAVTFNGDTIGNLGISNSREALPADHVFTRAEIESFINENTYRSP